MQENSRRTGSGRKGHNDCRSRITFHATSYHGYGNGARMAVQISATYGTPTPMRQASQGSELNRQTTSVVPNDGILLLHLCTEESNPRKSTSASWCCLDRPSSQLQCSARANP